jgi:hypothetical protein
MPGTSSVRCFDVSAATAAVRCFDVRCFGMTATAAASSAAAVRTLEGLRLLRVLPLEGLHLLRVLTL